MNQNNLSPAESPEFSRTNSTKTLLNNPDVGSVKVVEDPVANLKKDKTSFNTKILLFVIASFILILIIAGVILYTKEPKNSTDDLKNNIIPTNAELTPTNDIDDTTWIKPYDSEHTLFFLTSENGTTNATSTIYDVDQSKVLETKEFILPGDDIKDNYFGSHSSLNTSNGDVYISTFVNEIRQDGDDGPGSCYLSHIWGPGCQQSLYRVNLSDDSQQLLYQFKNSFAWILSPDNSKLFISEIDGSNLVIKIIDTETYQLTTLTTFSDLSDKFNLKRDLVNPLFVDDDNKTLYMMFTRTLVEGEKWEEVIRKVEIDTQKTNDIVVKGINDRFAFHSSISPDAKKLSIGYSDSVGNNDFVSKIAIFDLTTNLTTNIANVTIDNFNIVWGSNDSLYWKNKDLKLSKYDINTGLVTQLENRQTASSTPLSVSSDNEFLLIQNSDDTVLLYNIDTKSVTGFPQGLNLNILEAKGVKWLKI